MAEPEVVGEYHSFDKGNGMCLVIALISKIEMYVCTCSSNSYVIILTNSGYAVFTYREQNR